MSPNTIAQRAFELAEQNGTLIKVDCAGSLTVDKITEAQAKAANLAGGWPASIMFVSKAVAQEMLDAAAEKGTRFYRSNRGGSVATVGAPNHMAVYVVSAGAAERFAFATFEGGVNGSELYSLRWSELEDWKTYAFRLREALENMTGLFDTPAARLSIPDYPGSLTDECRRSARDALKIEPPKPREEPVTPSRLRGWG